MLLLKIAPTSDNDFGRYNCTATNRIGTRHQEYTLGQAGEYIVSKLLYPCLCIFTTVKYNWTFSVHLIPLEPLELSFWSS